MASGNRRVEGRENRGRCLFLIPGLCGESSQREGETRECKQVSRASSSPGRKEEFPLASDCLTCKNVAFVAELHSFFWQAVCDQLSPFPPLSLFLCRFTCLPSNPFSLDSAQLQPLQRNSEADWLAGYRPVVCYSSPTYPWIFLRKCPKVAGVDLPGSGCPLPHPLPLHSYEGDLASYRPTTVEPLPFSCLGEEQPGVGPL